MPLIAYLCSCSHSVKQYVRHPKDAMATIPCVECGLEMKKMMSAPSSVSKLVIDNGVQAKKTEIVSNIIELNAERANKDYSKKD